MSKQPRGLGKGLEALLGTKTDLSNIRKPVEYINKAVVTAEEPKGNAGVMLVPVGMIEPNPFQPRTLFDQGKLEELTESIRSYGLIQPITVRKISPERYQIISGERRYRACKLVGMQEVPSYIRDNTNDHEMIGMAIVENIQREDLDPIEVALSYQRLIDECNLTQEQMAAKVGKQRASVTNYLRLLRLPDKVQHDLRVGILSVGHAKVLLGIDDSEMQEKLCDLVIKNGLSVRQLEEKIRKIGKAEAEKEGAKVQDLPENYCKVLEIMGKYFSNSISLKRSNAGKGTMTIHFDSDEEVQKFLNAITESKL
ncbi:MAG: ParB/RepB/Spo0J family partition protein [Bacteroidales bacterium]|nr:ParB/RepB/Spo0J family partition protein [Bacteroidales bacterium]